jgi:predicted acylesterase/phospholipase RssA
MSARGGEGTWQARHSLDWLKAFPRVTNHHHVVFTASEETTEDTRREMTADLARVTRWLTGAAVGLVLGGGGSRGLAHIGVLRALHEERVPIDLVGGTSQGAFVGAAFARCVPRFLANLSYRYYSQPYLPLLTTDEWLWRAGAGRGVTRAGRLTDSPSACLARSHSCAT